MLPIPVQFALEILLGSLAGLLLLPSAVLFVECWMAVFAAPTAPIALPTHPPSLAVLMPAHNEAEVLQPTLATLMGQLQPGDRLVVVADNCTDETAARAGCCGAEVIERQDSERRGKGYALAFGQQHLAHHPPEVVILIDADCRVSPHSLAHLASQAHRTQRPTQAVNLLTPPAQPTPRDTISSLAFTLKNYVRPLGLQQLGQPCLLSMGVAMPWSTFSQLDLASGNLVEDMQMSLDLAIQGYPAQLCSAASVTGALPQQDNAARSQRTRWEHGHLQTLLKQVPRLIQAAWHQKRLNLLALALELSVPPLSLLVMLWLVSFGVTSLLAGLGWVSWRPSLLLAVAGGMIVTAILMAWAKFCRTTIPMVNLLAIPVYILWKIPLYVGFLVKPQSQWVRTQRDTPPT